MSRKSKRPLGEPAGATALERERNSAVVRAELHRGREAFYRCWREELLANGEDAGQAEELLLQVMVDLEEEERRIADLDEAIPNWTPPAPPPRWLRRRRERSAGREVNRCRRIHDRTQDPTDRLKLGYAIGDLERAGTTPPRSKEANVRMRLPRRRAARARGAGRPARRGTRSTRAGPTESSDPDPPPPAGVNAGWPTADRPPALTGRWAP